MMRVVIADDSRVPRDFLRATLRDMGWEVVGIAENGRIAVDLCRRNRPDLAIMDNSMAVMAGSEAAVAIIDQDLAKRVILLSSMSMKSVTDKFAGHARIGMLSKTNNSGHLAGLLKEKLEELGGVG